MKKYFTIFYAILFALSAGITYAKVINGIEIPDEILSKCQEYRRKISADYAACSPGEVDFDIAELNCMVKKNVKYEATHLCLVCGVYFPISSPNTENTYCKNEPICLDGFPKKIKFNLPPECPYCSSICPAIEFGEDRDNDLNMAILGIRRSEDHTLSHPCERYFITLEAINKILENEEQWYVKHQIYFKYARSGNSNDVKGDMLKALDYLEKYIAFKIKENNSDEPYIDIGKFMLRIELLRQTGQFDQALERLREFKEIIKAHPSSYFHILVELEEKLISEKKTNLEIKPFGNKVHIAIKNGNALNKLGLSKGELLKLANQCNFNGDNAFMQAMYDKDVNSLKLLLQYDKAWLRSNIEYGNTPLHMAAKLCDLETVKLLVDFGGDIEAKNLQQQTPLFLAVRYGNLPVMEYLLEKGADHKVRDCKNHTPLNVACIGKIYASKHIINRLVELEKVYNKNFEQEIQKCYLITMALGYPETYNILKQTGVKFAPPDDFVLIANSEMIQAISKEVNLSDKLYYDFCCTIDGNVYAKINAYKQAGLHDKFMERYKREAQCNK